MVRSHVDANRTLTSLIVLAFFLPAWSARAADEAPSFFRGLNLNGPAVVIDGQRWDGKDAKNYRCKDKAFENQKVSLLPATDVERAKMIRSSRWGGNRIELIDVPDGAYSVFLYLWEDNNPETFEIAVNGKTVVPSYRSGPTGHWEKLGPWQVDATDGVIVISSKGGAANFSGVEVWHGKHDGLPTIRDEDLAFFENRIRPLLAKHCYECHSAGSKEVQGELLVDSAPAMRKGGYTGPAVVPGDLDHSLLIKAVRYDNEEMQMPPDGKLSTAEIADLEKWVRIGAPDPRQQATFIPRRKIDVAQARQFWSLRPVVDPPVPPVRDETWPKNDLDRFILARLEAAGLVPLPPADKRTLIRRATFDLIGLPPTPEEIDAFLADESPQAFETVVERLLASPHYGERWGRHWMDLVRYADTAGDNSDYPIPQAYLYRNYIIRSLNDDKPYDQFLREQIAGDLLPAESDAQRNEQIIATGYLAISRRFGSLAKDYPQHLTIEDTLDNLGRTVLGMTLTCSRCHDHKFDPITQQDYYGLYGIFESTRYPFPGIELEKKPRDLVPLFEGGKPGKQLAYAMAEGKPGDARLQIRGEPQRLGDIVPRGFPEVLGGQMLSGDETKTSGRRQLAEWLTDRSNPLTPRVMANRIWQYHFGTGLVKTPSDFGTRGTPPTHPELLDWLSSRFMEHGWSLKQMHRLIMLSRTYQLASSAGGSAGVDDAMAASAAQVDPANDLHWRQNRRRLDAESLRDALLAISGELDETMLDKPHPFPPVDAWAYTQHHPFRESYDHKRRSVYLMTARLNARPFFTSFDGADRNASTPRRESSTTTVQSLYLLNDPFLHEQAEKFAARLLRESDGDEARLTRAFELALGRPPSQEEHAAAVTYFAELRDKLAKGGAPGEQRELQAWTSFARVMFRVNEFLYVD